MHKTGVWRSAGAALVIAGVSSIPARADQAGADALGLELDAVLSDIEDSLGIRVMPVEPIDVVTDGDAYVIEVAPVTIARNPDLPLAGEPGPSDFILSIDGFRVRLEPDSIERDQTHFRVDAMPGAAVSIDGVPFAHMEFEQLLLNGTWSNGLSLPTVVRIDGANLMMKLGFDPLSPFPLSDGRTLSIEVARIAQTSHLVAEGAGMWTMETKSYVEGIIAWMTQLDSDEGRQEVERVGVINNTTEFTGVPLEALRDLAEYWTPLLSEPTAVLTAEERRARIVAFVTELPPLFDTATVETELSDIFSNGTAMDRHHQYLSITDASTDALNIHMIDMAEGIRPVDFPVTPNGLNDGLIDMLTDSPELAALVETLTPVAYRSEMEFVDIPLGAAWRDLTATVDVWVDDPDAAMEVFFRRFGNAAMALESRGVVNAFVEWQDSTLTVTADFTASESVELGIAGLVDAGFHNMAAIGSALTHGVGPEAGTFWVVLQALGQQESPDGGSFPTTRYRIAVEPDGIIALNGIDFSPIVHLVESAFDAFSDSAFPPTID